MITLDKWFPTVIGHADCPFINEIKYDYQDILNNDMKNIEDEFIGFKYHQIHKDKKYLRLTKWVTNCVNEYAKEHKFPDEYECKESWLVDYLNYSSQPFHTHKGYTISTVFYFISDENDSPTIFKSPTNPDMKNPLKINVDRAGDNSYFNELTYPTVEYKPIEGRLLIFRSYLEHSTKPKVLKDKKRVIFSFNFDPK